ncbi:hypothetical protein KNCP2_10510 [Candidatus Rickettsia kedanie]|uniref:Transposase IS200-family protein n=1 Tax=Candidatus Rickettsia kedanie TaxID=3115352 RepID=A0ABP9TV48_9RICK
MIILFKHKNLGTVANSAGNITDEMIQQYIDEQEGEPINDDRFLIDSTL